MKRMMMPIIIGALETILKGFVRGLEELEIGGCVETTLTTALTISAGILRRVLEFHISIKDNRLMLA